MDPNDGTTTSERAAELRASLGTRRQAEALLAEASAARQAAAADADAIVEEAQQLSDQLVTESQGEADRITTDARDRADGIVTRARDEAEDITRTARATADAVRAKAEADVEEYRRRVRNEVTEQVTGELEEQNRVELTAHAERQEAMIGDIEASVRILGVSLESAVANVGEMLGSLEGLRAYTTESLSDPGLGALSAAAKARQVDADDDAALRDDLFRATAGASGSDTSGEESGDATAAEASADDSDGDGDTDDDEDDHAGDAAPLSATEAFLQSAHLDHGDPPLPPTDDAEIGQRYARDAMRSTARTRSGGDGSAAARGADEGDDAHGVDDQEAAKPLGWLFRS